MRYVFRALKIGIVIAIPILILLSVVKGGGMYASIYNSLISNRQAVNKALGDLDTQYQRRYALVENLVSIVRETKKFEKYIMNFEKEAYSAVAEAKASATKMDISIPEEAKKRLAKEDKLGNILTNLLDKIAVFAQTYPTITDPNIKEHNKTFESLDKLREEIKALESEIMVSRQNLNEYVRVYNTNIGIFPANFVAKNHNFKEVNFFTALTEEAREDVKINF